MLIRKRRTKIFSKSIAKIRKVRACGAIFLDRWTLKNIKIFPSGQNKI
jgi:hypothetical protein